MDNANGEVSNSNKRKRWVAVPMIKVEENDGASASNKRSKYPKNANLYDIMMDRTTPLMKVDYENIKNAAIDLKQLFKTWETMEVDFDIPNNLRAVYYIYSTLNAGVVRNRFVNAFHNCTILKNYIGMPYLRLLSIGRGDSAAKFGLCSGIQEVNKNTFRYFDMRHVDLCQDMTPSSLFEREYFIRDNYLDKHCESFKHADTVSLFGIANYPHYRGPNRNDTFEKIAARIKNGALFLLFDPAARSQDIPGLEKIYASDLPEFKLTVENEGMHPIVTPTTSDVQIAVFRKPDVE